MDGGSDVCLELVKQDVMTPLVMLVKQVNTVTIEMLKNGHQ